MSKSNHPIEQEELMAYLDGELATNRAVAAAAHLEHCAECQEVAADLRKLSQEMMAWEVEQSESSSEIPDEIVAALEKRKKQPKKQASIRRRWSMLFTPKKLVFAGGSAVVMMLILSFFSFSPLRPVPKAQLFQQEDKLERYYTPKPVPSPPSKPGDDSFSPSYGRNSSSVNGNADAFASRVAPPPPPPSKPSASESFELSNTDGNLNDYAPGVGSVGKLSKTNDSPEQGSEGDEIDNSEHTVPTVPMIARTAGLTLTTKEFDKSRAALEEILKRHSGYMGELKVSAPADSGRTLTATLRVPGPQLEAAMTELKKLGRVEDESQGGEEVTQQYVDLQARLANGIHTEQRLTEILRTRTGKLQDVLKVELEIDRVRGEIEQMQAEKKELSKRVAFATLSTTVREEYFAKLQPTPPSTGSRFRNAAVDGYNTVVEGLIDVGLFLLSAGPSLLLWAAILFFPARWAWKKIQSQRRRDAEEESV